MRGETEEAHGPGGSGREWEGRARELMEVVARQEEQIRELRETVYGTRFDDHGVEVEYVSPDDARLLDDVEALGDVDVDDEWDEEWNFEEEDYDLEEGGSSLAKPIAGALAAGVAALVGGLVTRQVRNRGSDGMEVEVDLEPRHGSATDVRVDEEYRETRRETLGATGDLAYDATGRPRTGEMEVEVDLEQQRPRGYSDAPEYPRTAQPQGDGDIQAEVDLEPRAGEQPFRGGQGGTTGQGGLPTDPPLM